VTKQTLKKHISWFFSGVLVFFLISFSSENDPLQKIIAAFEQYVSVLPQEKIYLHQDRTYYASGETIWFKAYLTAGPYHEPSSLSRTIYVELINTKNEVIQEHTLFTPDGFASGQLQLPDSLSSGQYLLRAYTNWMRNSGEEYFFHRPITIWNEAPPILEQVSQDDLDIQFFPEGGHLVQGILSKVAFKVLGGNGLGKKVKGQILEGDRVLAEFESNPLGMGIFPLLPEKDKSYKARIEGSGQEVNLPTSLKSGIVMAVINSPKATDVVIKIQVTENSQIQTLNLLAQTRGLICASVKADLSKKIVFARIPKNEFPSGIAQLTALDENGIPLAERLIFIDHQDQITISVATDKSTYAPREPIRMDIEVKTKDGKPSAASLSLSVFDAGQIGVNKNKDNIHSNLLLTSELKGYVETPGYYFNPENSDREEALDILMLTQGWRKFTIKEALAGERLEPAYRVEKGLTIRGVLKNQKTNQPEAQGSVSYLSLYPIAASKTANANSAGKFEIQDLIFFDSTEVMLEGKSKNNRSTARILIENPPSPPLLFYTSRSEISQSLQANSFISELNKRRTIDKAFDFENSEFELEGVEVKGRRIEESFSGPRIYGNGSAKIQVAGILGLENQFHPLDLVKGRVAGVQVTGSGPGSTILIRGVGSVNSEVEPLIMLDDIPIRVASLDAIQVQEIESYTVWKGPDTAIFGVRGANGVIGFYTKKRSADFAPSAEISDFPKLLGYQIEQEFYTPKYTSQDNSSTKPDRRVTLYWNPTIQTDSQGRASLLFYNNDVETMIQAEIEGLSIQGNPGTARLQYKIVK
jgi:hypothetical protein